MRQHQPLSFKGPSPATGSKSVRSGIRRTPRSPTDHPGPSRPCAASPADGPHCSRQQSRQTRHRDGMRPPRITRPQPTRHKRHQEPREGRDLGGPGAPPDNTHTGPVRKRRDGQVCPSSLRAKRSPRPRSVWLLIRVLPSTPAFSGDQKSPGTPAHHLLCPPPAERTAAVHLPDRQEVDRAGGGGQCWARPVTAAAHWPQDNPPN